MPPKKSKKKARPAKAKSNAKKHSPKTEHLKAYQWKPGQSGNLSGRPKSKPIKAAIEAVLSEDPKLLKKIALNAAKQAARSLGFFTEVRDMFDGKPVQQISGPDEGPIPTTVEGIDEALLKLLAIAEERKTKKK